MQSILDEPPLLQHCLAAPQRDRSKTDPAANEKLLADVRVCLEGLSDHARQFVQAAALIGETFTLHAVAELQSVTTLSLLPALDEAVAAFLIQVDQSRLSFRSPLIPHIVAEEIPASFRNVLRRGMGGPPSLAAKHSPAAENPAPGDIALAERVVAALFLTCGNLSRPPTTQLVTTIRDALITLFKDHGGEAAATRITSLISDNEEYQRERIRLVFAEERLDAAEVIALVVLSNLEWAAGHLGNGLHWGAEALCMSGSALPPSWRPYPALSYVLKLGDLGRLAEGEEKLAWARAEAERLGSEHAMAVAKVVRGRLLLGAARIAEAEVELEAGLALCERAGATAAVPEGRSLLALAALQRGDVDMAAEQLSRSGSYFATDDVTFSSVRHEWVDFHTAAAQLNPMSAAKIFTEKRHILLSQPLIFVQDHSAAAQLVRLMRAVDDTSSASTVVRTMERLVAHDGPTSPLRAGTEHARGVLDDDPAPLEYAVREHNAPWAAAMASADLGMLLSKKESNPAAANRHLRDASQRYSDMGAWREVAWVQSWLHTIQQDSTEAPGSAISTASPTSLPARKPPALDYDLTTMQHQIASMVADGMTNQQVARRISRSPHTVNYHLRKIFQKLDVNSRVELTRHFHGANDVVSSSG